MVINHSLGIHPRRHWSDSRSWEVNPHVWETHVALSKSLPRNWKITVSKVTLTKWPCESNRLSSVPHHRLDNTQPWRTVTSPSDWMLPWQLVVCGYGEWAGGDATNALATAGVGNETRTARARKNCKTEGRIREENACGGQEVDDWRGGAEGAGRGWKMHGLKPPRNYDLIMHRGT